MAAANLWVTEPLPLVPVIWKVGIVKCGEPIC